MSRLSRMSQFAVLASLIFGVMTSSNAFAEDTAAFRKLRLQMVNEVIAPEGITNEAVLSAVRSVPRHEFVGGNLKRRAYFDQALPIGFQQTISPPFVVSYMTQMIDPQPEDKVLEIGTGSGYQAAILSKIVKEVYTIEIVASLGRTAASRLKRLGYDNVTAKVGDGYKGWEEHAPFDKIIVTCSPEDVPQPLVDQLRDGGKMIVPLGQRYQQLFYLFEKKDGKLSEQQLIPTLFVPMTGRAEENRKILPDPKNPQINNGGFEIDENDDGRVDAWHYQRQNELAHDDPPEGKAYMKIHNETPGRGAQLLQGFAIDGATVRALEVRLWVRLDRGRRGERVFEKPALYIHFYDKSRRVISDIAVGPWTGTFAWKQIHQTIKIPPRATEAVLRVGLNGATGTLSVDDIQVSAR